MRSAAALQPAAEVVAEVAADHARAEGVCGADADHEGDEEPELRRRAGEPEKKSGKATIATNGSVIARPVTAPVSSPSADVPPQG